MLLELVIVLLFICACGYAGLGMWTSQQRRRFGLAGGRVHSADDSRLGSPTLRSERLGLVARPDHVLEVNGMRIPVEQKPSARRVWPSHELQVAAQCALLEEASGARPTHAVLVLADGRQERVLFTSELEDQLAGTMRRMRQALESNEAPGPCWSRAKCLACGYRQICWGAERIGSTPRSAPCDPKTLRTA
ncbi:MAG TPA: CRISPR-associated protein Cas4 [Chloroflexota bacterium]